MGCSFRAVRCAGFHRLNQLQHLLSLCVTVQTGAAACGPDSPGTGCFHSATCANDGADLTCTSSTRSRTCLHAKHQSCQADNVLPLMGPRHACWRGGGIRRTTQALYHPLKLRGHSPRRTKWLGPATTTQRNAFPSCATFSLPRNIFPSTQRSPFHATYLPRNAPPSTQHFHFRVTPTQPQAPRATSDAIQDWRVSS